MWFSIPAKLQKKKSVYLETIWILTPLDKYHVWQCVGKFLASDIQSFSAHHSIHLTLVSRISENTATQS